MSRLGHWRDRMGRTKTVLGEKVREALASVLPITAIVLVLCLTVAPLPVDALLAFLAGAVLLILGMGVVAFGLGTAGGVLLAKFMNLFLKEKINPLIGSAGVSAVPMAARVSQVEGQKANPANFLLMHAMGPNVAGVIGSAIAAGVLMALFG